MRPRATLRKPAIFTRRFLSLIVRAAAITSMSFGVAFGFLSGTTAPGAHYDPYMLRHRRRRPCSAPRAARIGHSDLAHPPDEAELRASRGAPRRSGRPQLGNQEAQERAKSFFEAQDDVIVRRDGDGAHHLRQRRVLRAGRASRGETCWRPRSRCRSRSRANQRARRRHARLRPEDRRTATARAGSPGAKSRCARDGGSGDCKASAATSPTASRPSARWPRHATRRKRPTAPSRGSWRWCRTRFRTPLNGILGMADLLGDTALSPEQATYLKAVKTSGETLLALIDEILDFSKIEAGTARSRGAAICARAVRRGSGRTARSARPGQRLGNLLLCRRAPAARM